MSAIGPVTAHHTEDGRVCVHVVVTDFVQGAASGDLGPGHAVPELPTGTHGTASLDVEGARDLYRRLGEVLATLEQG